MAAQTDFTDKTLKLFINGQATNLNELPIPCVITGKNGIGKSTFLKNSTDHLFSQLEELPSKTEVDKELKKDHPIFLRFSSEEVNFLDSADCTKITQHSGSDEIYDKNYHIQVSKLPDMQIYQNKINDLDLSAYEKCDKQIYLTNIKDISYYLCFKEKINFIEFTDWKITLTNNLEYRFEKEDKQVLSKDLLFTDLYFLYNFLVKRLTTTTYYKNFLKVSLYINGMSAHDLMSTKNILKYFYFIKSDMIDEINDHLSNNALQLKGGFKLIYEDNERSSKITGNSNFFIFYIKIRIVQTEIE
jgi:hypothetical protein